jgi:two-component system, response regulator PdtaR
MKSYRILVVDDDRDVRAMLSDWLQDYNHCPTATARCADEALALLDRQSFDLVLTNNMMPGMLGVEMAAVIRRRGGPPVIVITGYHSNEIRRQAFASGVRACLCKPIKLEWLPELIEAVLDRGLHYIGCGPPGGYEKGKDRTEKNAE